MSVTMDPAVSGWRAGLERNSFGRRSPFSLNPEELKKKGEPSGASTQPGQEEEVSLSSTLYQARTLSDEEQKLLEEMMQKLTDILSSGVELTAEDKRRAREIRRDIEKLTGVPMPGGKAFDKMLGSTEDADPEDVDPLERRGKAALQFQMEYRNLADGLKVEPGKAPGPGAMEYGANLLSMYGGGNMPGGMLSRKI